MTQQIAMLTSTLLGAVSGAFGQAILSYFSHKRELRLRIYEKRFQTYSNLILLIKNSQQDIFNAYEKKKNFEYNDYDEDPTYAFVTNTGEPITIQEFNSTKLIRFALENRLLISQRIYEKLYSLSDKMKDLTLTHDDVQNFTLHLKSELQIKD